MPGLDSLCGVWDIKHVRSRPREKEARELLEKIADQVREGACAGSCILHFCCSLAVSTVRFAVHSSCVSDLLTCYWVTRTAIAVLEFVSVSRDAV